MNATLKQEINSTFTTAAGLHQRGNFEQAESLYRAILNVDPDHCDAMHLLGVLAHQVGRNDLACELIENAVELNPREPHYRYSLGVAAQALGKLEAAVSAYRAAVRMQPDHLQALQNLGAALQDSNEPDAAAAVYEQALTIDRHSPTTLLNLATLLLNSGKTAEALARLSDLLATSPVNTEAHWKRSHALLTTGRFDEGWAEYEWRFFAQSFLRDNAPKIRPFPKWDGSPLTDGRILVVAEQGVGDEVMFASCLPDVIAAARSCALECDPRLVDLVERSFPGVEVVAANPGCAQYYRMEPFDFQISAATLPKFVRATATTFGAGEPYLRTDRHRQSHWRGELAALGDGPNIGISWRAGKGARARRERSIALNEWQHLFENTKAKFINLQYGDHAAEIAAFPAHLHHLDGLDPLTDLDDFSALISVLDLVISVDNSTVHFAGALGTPVWILLPRSAEWRWLGADHSTSIWYSSARLFRHAQEPTASWRDVLGEVADALGRHDFSSRKRDAELSGPDIGIVPRTTSRAQDRPRALLLDDASNWHDWGNACSSLAIHDALRRVGYAVESVPTHRVMAFSNPPGSVQEFDDDATFAQFCDTHRDLVEFFDRCDTVYVNGAGSLCEAGPAAFALLYLAHVSKSRFGKSVHMVNHSCHSSHATAGNGDAFSSLYAKVFRQLDHVTVREPLSLRQLTKMGIDAKQGFDCLPLFLDGRYPTSTRQPGNNIVIAGSARWTATSREAFGEFIACMHRQGTQVQILFGANAYPAAADLRFIEEMHRSAAGCFTPIAAMSEFEWLNCIRDAGLVVSGRPHASIVAAFLDTPLLLVEDGTPAIAGLAEMLGQPTSVSSTAPDLASALCDRAKTLISSPDTALLDDATKTGLRSLCRENLRKV